MLLLLCMVFFPAALNRIPMSCLAAILMVTGWNYWINRKLNWAPIKVASDKVVE